MNETFLSEFMGCIPPKTFLIYLIWAYIGVATNLFIELLKRKPESLSSPKDLNASYYLKDNLKRLCVAVVLVPIALLLCKEFLNMDITKGVAFGIGFSSDTLAELYKRKSVMNT